MNCLVFKSEDDLGFLPNSDYKAQHIKKYLKPKNGDIIYVAIARQFLAKAKISINEKSYSFEIVEKLSCPNLRNIEIAVALARPQIAQKILFDCACLGVSKLNFYIANKSEASYANSSLYSEGLYEEHLIRGIEQACNCYLPQFEIHSNLESFLSKLGNPSSKELRIAPDLYEAQGDFADIVSNGTYEKAILILGAERGFNNKERKSLREKEFKLALMRERVMRTDTALAYALGLLHSIG